MHIEDTCRHNRKNTQKNYKAYPKSTEKNAGQSQLTTDFYPFTVNQAIFALSDHRTPYKTFAGTSGLHPHTKNHRPGRGAFSTVMRHALIR